MEEDNRTIGEIISEKIEEESKKYNDLFTNLFIYGPDILNMNINDLKEKEDINDTNK